MEHEARKIQQHLCCRDRCRAVTVIVGRHFDAVDPRNRMSDPHERKIEPTGIIGIGRQEHLGFARSTLARSNWRGGAGLASGARRGRVPGGAGWTGRGDGR